MFVEQEYDSFTVFRSKMEWRVCCLGKCSCGILKNSCPMLVATLLLYGGLYHTILLLRFLVERELLWLSLSYASFSEYPASPRAPS